MLIKIQQREQKNINMQSNKNKTKKDKNKTDKHHNLYFWRSGEGKHNLRIEIL